ncbi:MAG: twin-arginine translocase subunit TatB [Phenylobacterium sp.]|uniref:Sec-independent protein translocase protein TatB n=1 Tax=Phenylobacterium sp. TaxID=1871053 RepID=UPI0025D49EBE|nr:Sec-independent protein translocase protein TatB [Phenylobacterium sp.]MBI1196636.1 twin-arginine translocase subunit TatB [Phenylobacterium sp.]
MLPEVGGLEWLIIAVVALVVVGPKDLPIMLRRLGQFVARMRGMAAEFRASFDEMARQSELDDLRKEVEAMRRGQIADIASHTGEAEMRSTVSEIEQSLSDVGVQLHPPMSHQYPAPESAPSVEVSETPPKPAAKARTRKPKAETPSAAKPKPKAKSKPKPKPVAEGGPKKARGAGKIVEAGS